MSDIQGSILALIKPDGSSLPDDFTLASKRLLLYQGLLGSTLACEPKEWPERNSTTLAWVRPQTALKWKLRRGNESFHQIYLLWFLIAETHLENLLVKSFKVTSMEQKRDQK